MTDETLTSLLAERVLGWGTGPDRFQTGKRGWIPRWRFQPVMRLADAVRLLEAAAPEEQIISSSAPNAFWVRVCIRGVNGEARETSRARAITYAVARAVGIGIEGTR